MNFIIISRNKKIREHIQKLFLDEQQNVTGTGSVVLARRLARKLPNSCIVFDINLCPEGYGGLIENFNLEGTLYFIPLKETWADEEVIEAINLGTAYALEYECSKESVQQCIKSVRARSSRFAYQQKG